MQVMAPQPKIYGIYIVINKHISLMILIIKGQGSGNYTIVGWGAITKELFP